MTSSPLIKNIPEYKNKFQRAFADYHKSLREALGELEESDALSGSLVQLLSEALFQNDLKANDSMAVYWLDMLDDIFFIAQIHEDTENGEATQEEAEEELFSFWNESDYALAMQEMLTSTPIMLASRKLLAVMEVQAEAFYQLHFHDNGLAVETPLFYKPIPELGDHSGRFYLPRQGKSVALDYKDEFYIHSTKPLKVSTDGSLVLQAEFENTLSITNGITFLPSDAEFSKDALAICEKIKMALSHIEAHSPESFKLFSEFTKYIIPIREKGIVSYSMDNLPGVSCLNLNDRDSIDLIDDLVHESGHHFLNCILGAQELINEDDEKIFFSPWRRSLRPIRGLYHAVFTFYWAMKLFSDLSQSNLKEKVSNEEWQKINSRAIEEAMMISFCGAGIEEAIKRKKITKSGAELIKPIIAEAKALLDKVPAMKANLSGDALKNIEELEADIAVWTKEYKFK